MEGLWIPAAPVNANKTFTLGSSYQGQVNYEKESGKAEQMFVLSLPIHLIKNAVLLITHCRCTWGSSGPTEVDR